MPTPPLVQGLYALFHAAELDSSKSDSDKANQDHVCGQKGTMTFRL